MPHAPKKKWKIQPNKQNTKAVRVLLFETAGAMFKRLFDCNVVEVS